MKKVILIFSTLLAMVSIVNAQSIKETFDANSLEWTECAYESNNGSAIIDKGVLTIKSKGVNKGLTALLGTQVGSNTFFETHCYAPLDVMKPFKIRTHVNISKLSFDQMAGLIFNYKDYGTFYCFAFNEEQINFLRYENNILVGGINQGIKWKDKKKVDQEWELESDGHILRFSVDGMEILNVRYMPLIYAGVGFYTFGKQTLVVDDIEFIQ